MAQRRSTHIRSDISYLSLLGFYLLLLFLTSVLFEGAFTKNVDRLLHDYWVRLDAREAPSDVVIVGIDYESLDRIGQWPWGRDLQASFFNKLTAAGVKAVLIDLLYLEQGSNDAALAEALGQLPIAILPLGTEGHGEYTGGDEKLPLPEFYTAVNALGHIAIPLDGDGIARRVNLLAGFKSAHWPALSLALYQELYGGLAEDEIPGLVLENSFDHTKWKEPEPFPWIENRQVLIPFYGPARTFKNVSFDSVLRGRLGADELKDKIVFVGSTATGMGDVLPTAVSSIDTPMPGVEIHANIFSALRDGILVEEVDYRLSFLIASVLLFFILLLYSRLSPLWGLIGAAVFALIPIFVSYYLYVGHRLWYPPLVASVPMLVSYFLWSWHRLDFVSDFLRQETDKLSEEFGVVDNTNNLLLAKFFESANRHLPMQGWAFSAGGQSFGGGESVATSQIDASFGEWSVSNGLYQKRYATPGNLTIAFSSADEKFAGEFSSYIDSLARVKERQTPARLTGSIERLQVNTYRLSTQMDRLRQLNGLSESMFEGSSAGLIVWSPAGEIVRINDLAKSMLPEILHEDVELREFVRRIGRDPDQQDADRLQRLLLQSEPWQINRIEDDQEVVINFHAVGDTLAERLVSASIVDVSEIRRSERSRAELIDFLSHDLRSPLISSLYMLSDDLKVSDADNDSKIQRIETNINLSLTMMDDLLTIARADNLSAEQFSPALFDSIIDNAVDQLVPQARGRNIKIEIDDQDEEIWVNADAALLERAVVNIVSNAIKYSPDDTRVTIAYSLQAKNILLTVQDQGIGIAPEMMEHLFQRFKRDANISKKFKGIGLGLALVARVITQHGGRVWASSPGEGTCISVELPLALLSDDSA